MPLGSFRQCTPQGNGAFFLHPSSPISLASPACSGLRVNASEKETPSEMACQCREQPWPLGPSQEPMLQGQPQPDRHTWFEVVSCTLDRVGGHCGFCPEADVGVWHLSGRAESSGVGLGIPVLPSGEGLSGHGLTSGQRAPVVQGRWGGAAFCSRVPMPKARGVADGVLAEPLPLPDSSST